jgi:hypothetical protein
MDILCTCVLDAPMASPMNSEACHRWMTGIISTTTELPLPGVRSFYFHERGLPPYWYGYLICITVIFGVFEDLPEVSRMRSFMNLAVTLELAHLPMHRGCTSCGIPWRRICVPIGTLFMLETTRQHELLALHPLHLCPSGPSQNRTQLTRSIQEQRQQIAVHHLRVQPCR